MTPNRRQVATAERIIKTQGLAFALACAVVGKSPTGEADLVEARKMLAAAIVQALAEEFARGYKNGADEERPHGMTWEEATS